ncbi:hypothetical protein P9B82_04190, partial [Bacillus paralicheniformis]|uniref:hypothetical protein n=1 Tax=Bacillus paralicheniformis TaxID=1648923 RepID=UPI002DBC39F8
MTKPQNKSRFGILSTIWKPLYQAAFFMHKLRKKEKNRINHRSERMLHDAQTVRLPASRHSAVKY